MFSQKKPYSAVTVTIERLTGEAYEEDDLSGIPDLVEVIKLQSSGPAEAARAIRKKLKYGSAHRQLRALTLLDGLIQNAGPRFQRTFADEPLLERLRVCGTSDLVDPDVRRKCSVLFRSWAAEYKATPGLDRVAHLYKELPKRKQVVTQERSKVIRETDNPFGDEEDEQHQQQLAQAQAQAAAASSSSPSSSRTPQALSSPKPASSSLFGNSLLSSPSSSSAKDKSKKKDKDRDGKRSGGKRQHRKFDLEAEKEHMKTAIAESSIAATNLNNALQSINREKERISENPNAVAHFEACKQLRRKILRYIHHVESEQWLGSLLHANDELVMSLMTFEQLDRSIDADSDSDDELAEQAHIYRMMTEKAKGQASSSAPQSPTTATIPSFSSSSAVTTPPPPSIPSSALANLSLTSPSSPPPPPAAPPTQPPRPAAPPPRPSANSKPSSHLSIPGGAPLRNSSSSNNSNNKYTDDDSDPDEEEDENDPFADRNAVITPRGERSEPTWS